MLDLRKLDVESTKIISSFTREKFLEWEEMDNKRMALAQQEERMTKHNGELQSGAANHKGTTIKKPAPTKHSTTRVRVSNRVKETVDSCW